MQTFEFTVQPDFNFLREFGTTFGTEVFDDHLTLPASLGEGSIRQIQFSDQFRFSIHRYTLVEDLLVRRLAAHKESEFISLIFYSSGRLADGETGAFTQRGADTSGIRLAYGDNSSEVRFAAHSEVFFSVVGISVREFTGLVGETVKQSLISTVSQGNASFFYFEDMVPEIDRLLRELATTDEHGTLGNLYFRMRVYELIYLTIGRLLKREVGTPKSLASEEMEKLFRIRSAVLQDLSLPPKLPDLAHGHHLSETKMKQLFRQVFGDTIYNYYQTARMEQAAHQLRLPDRTVADVGYALGFLNLSHFSRLFKRHYGVTPKKYSLAG